MDLSAMFENINWVAILGATVVSMVWSFVWYSKSLAGKQWMEAVGVKESELQKAYAKGVMPVVFFLSVISSFTLAILLSDVQGWVDGIFDGLVIGVGLAATQVLILYAFALRSRKLMMIDATWVIVDFSLMGLTIGLIS
jgi:hypothetical protein